LTGPRLPVEDHIADTLFGVDPDEFKVGFWIGYCAEVVVQKAGLFEGVGD